MARPDDASLKDLSLAELRKLLGTLIGRIGQPWAETLALRTQNQ